MLCLCATGRPFQGDYIEFDVIRDLQRLVEPDEAVLFAEQCKLVSVPGNVYVVVTSKAMSICSRVEQPELGPLFGQKHPLSSYHCLEQKILMQELSGLTLSKWADNFIFVHTVVKPAVAPPPWLPDNQALHCAACRSVFSFFRRRHHCRGEGYISVKKQKNKKCFSFCFSQAGVFLL